MSKLLEKLGRGMQTSQLQLGGRRPVVVQVGSNLVADEKDEEPADARAFVRFLAANETGFSLDIQATTILDKSIEAPGGTQEARAWGLRCFELRARDVEDADQLARILEFAAEQLRARVLALTLVRGSEDP